MPRALELVQFLSIYCTSLSSRQQIRVSDFQVASFTHLALSKTNNCDICPGFCTQPLALVVPMFAVTSCLFALVVVVVMFDARNLRNPDRITSTTQHRLLVSSTASDADAAVGRSSLLRNTVAFCVRYFRSFIDTCSAYILMPCTFVFVLNVQPSSFSHAGFSDRAMIVMIPVLGFLLRALLIRRCFVPLTSADQMQLYIGSACSCGIAAVLCVYFDRAANSYQTAPEFDSETSPQYIVLSVLVVQVMAQTIVRLRATQVSIFDQGRVVGSNMKSSSSIAIAVAKFFLLNDVAISQIAMVITGLASARATSETSIDISSVFIGIIPLILNGVMLLHNVVKFVKFILRKCCHRLKDTGSHSDDGLY
jgi:hypothetical protein